MGLGIGTTALMLMPAWGFYSKSLSSLSFRCKYPYYNSFQTCLPMSFMTISPKYSSNIMSYWLKFTLDHNYIKYIKSYLNYNNINADNSKISKQMLHFGKRVISLHHVTYFDRKISDSTMYGCYVMGFGGKIGAQLLCDPFWQKKQ